MEEKDRIFVLVPDSGTVISRFIRYPAGDDEYVTKIPHSEGGEAIAALVSDLQAEFGQDCVLADLEKRTVTFNRVVIVPRYYEKLQEELLKIAEQVKHKDCHNINDQLELTRLTEQAARLHHTDTGYRFTVLTEDDEVKCTKDEFIRTLGGAFDGKLVTFDVGAIYNYGF